MSCQPDRSSRAPRALRARVVLNRELLLVRAHVARVPIYYCHSCYFISSLIHVFTCALLLYTLGELTADFRLYFSQSASLSVVATAGAVSLSPIYVPSRQTRGSEESFSPSFVTGISGYGPERVFGPPGIVATFC